MLGLGLPAQAGPLYSWKALSINGNQSPPPYGMRLDGFFDGDTSHEVTFAFDDVAFDEFSTTAYLYGTISVAEYNNSGGPGAHASTWNLDVWFDRVDTPSGGNASYRYYLIQPGGPTDHELVKVGDANDVADLWSFPTDGSKPFQVGFGANEKNGNFGAAGWLTFKHGDIGPIHLGSDDFLMDLEPTHMPEPGTLTLLAIGFLGLALTGAKRLYPARRCATGGYMNAIPIRVTGKPLTDIGA
jgi:hypothetical protein